MKLPIFITGCARTGTTFMLRVLGSHPDIDEVLGESNLLLEDKIIGMLRSNDKETSFNNFENFFWNKCFERGNLSDGWRNGINNYKSQSICELVLNRFKSNYLSEKSPEDSLRILILELFSKGNKFFIEKSPLHCFHMSDIKLIFPEAIIIYMERPTNLILESLPEQYWFKNNNPKKYVSDILSRADAQLNLVDDVIRVNLLDFVKDPSIVFSELISRGIPESGFKEVRKFFEETASLKIASRDSDSKSDKSRRVN